MWKMSRILRILSGGEVESLRGPDYFTQEQERLLRAQHDFMEAVRGVVEENERLRRMIDAKENTD